LLSLSLTGLWARLLRVPYRWLFPVVLLLCAMGIYATRHSVFAVWLVAAFGVVGYVFHKLDMAPTPLLLGYAMGPVMEGALRSSLEQSEGDWSVFATRPLSAGVLTVALGLVFLVLIPGLKLSRLRAWLED
jgi:putative tricarboxylic transport membrane protein